MVADYSLVCGQYNIILLEILGALASIGSVINKVSESPRNTMFSYLCFPVR